MTKNNNKSYELNARRSILIILLILIVVFIVFIPKIWLRSNIYYTSKDINKLYSHFISLKEENIILKQQLEDMKFKNQIIDSILLQQIKD